MKLKTLLSIGAIILCNISFAQHIPDEFVTAIVGGIIEKLTDKEEKVNYEFSYELDYNTSNYKSEEYLTANYYYDNPIMQMQLDSNGIINYQAGIDRLLKYYSDKSTYSLGDKNIKSKGKITPPL